MTLARTDGTALIDLDPWLKNYEQPLRERHHYYEALAMRFNATGGLLGSISQGHRYFGFNRGELFGKPGVWYREWAPGALQLRLIGDFNNWDRYGNPLVRDEFGVWSLFLPDDKFASKLTHGSKLKVHVVHDNGTTKDRIPAYIQRVLQEGHSQFVGQYWNPEQPYQWKHQSPSPRDGGLRIYEAHVGMAQEEGKVGLRAAGPSIAFKETVTHLGGKQRAASKQNDLRAAVSVVCFFTGQIVR